MDGIWTGEILGPYGWESSGVYVLENGRILGGNNRHYSTGTFTLSGNDYAAQISVNYYGPPRAILGGKNEQFEIEVAGELKSDVLEAVITKPNTSAADARFRMTKRMDLPQK